MSSKFATVECSTYPSATACPICLRYADVPGALTTVDFAAGGCNCHLVHIQPARDRATMEIHFTGCRQMLADLVRVLHVDEIQSESSLLAPFCSEYRQAGLCVGVIREMLNEDDVETRLLRCGRPVRFTGKGTAQARSRNAELPVL